MSFAAPVAGWIANRALANPRSVDGPGAAVLDNYFPRAGSVKLRRGYTPYAELEESELDVPSLFSYRNGDNRRLFAANDDRIYDITNDPPAVVMDGLTGSDWSVVQFATSGGVYLIGVNGSDDGFIFDGTDFWPNVSGGVTYLAYDALTLPFTAGATLTGGTSGATGTIYKVVSLSPTVGYVYLTGVSGTFVDNETITGGGGSATSNGPPSIASPGVTFTGGLTMADMSYVWAYKNRLWYAEKSSQNAWYMEDADAIGGNAVVFPLAGVFSLGGALLFGQTWSTEAGDQGGLSEQNIFVSTEGEVAVYQGTDPSTADTWSKVGVYRIGKPLGKRAFFRGGGDLAIATSVGLVPLSKAISLDVTSLNPATVSYKISDAWQDAIDRRGLIGWHCELWPEQRMALIAVPDILIASDPVLFVSNTETGAWCRFTGWPALAMEVFEGQLYFGSSAGRVFAAGVTGLDNASLYTGTVVPLFDDLGSPGSRKIGKIARGVSKSSVRVNSRLTFKVDFDDSRPPAPDATIVAGVSVWNDSEWGTAFWSSSAPSVLNQDWRSVGGLGYAVSVAYQVTSGDTLPLDDELVRMDLTFTLAEIVT